MASKGNYTPGIGDPSTQEDQVELDLFTVLQQEDHSTNLDAREEVADDITVVDVDSIAAGTLSYGSLITNHAAIGRDLPTTGEVIVDVASTLYTDGIDAYKTHFLELTENTFGPQGLTITNEGFILSGGALNLAPATAVSFSSPDTESVQAYEQPPEPQSSEVPDNSPQTSPQSQDRSSGDEDGDAQTTAVASEPLSSPSPAPNTSTQPTNTPSSDQPTNTEEVPDSEPSAPAPLPEESTAELTAPEKEETEVLQKLLLKKNPKNLQKKPRTNPK